VLRTNKVFGKLTLFEPDVLVMVRRVYGFWSNNRNDLSYRNLKDELGGIRGQRSIGDAPV
jgi:hypothetical protein